MKITQSLEAQNFASAYAPSISRANTAYVPHRQRDEFSYSTKKINPAAQNPIYLINDEILANAFPQALINKYANENFLLAAADSNPNIKNILNEAGSPVAIYSKNIFSNAGSHFVPTVKTAHDIMDNCDEKFTKKDYNTMAQAALLHDVGKAYIPEKILNKNGKLTPMERRIVDAHARLGYEALKSGGVSTPVLALVRSHHSYGENNLSSNPMVQILQIADIYCALKEARPYKESFSDEKALKILYERAEAGDFDSKYVDVLRTSIE